MPYVTVGQIKLHYHEVGEGIPLLLLHGLGSNADSWKPQLEELSQDFRVIAWDAPGYGKSEDPPEEIHYFDDFARILKGFVDQLQLDRFYLLGHSMGSTLALSFYKLYPDAIRALILADGTRGGAAKDGEKNEEKLKSRLESIETMTAAEIAKARLKNLLAPQASKAVREEAERIYGMIRPKGYRSVSYSLYHADQSAILQTIQVPTLVICGELDRITPVSESKIIYEGISDAKMITIPNTGHLCYQEEPQIFNQHVRSFVKDVRNKIRS